MKITKRQLKQIIKEELALVVPTSSEEKGEGSMARGQLARSAEISSMLLELISEDDNLPEWVEAKITLSQDYLGTVLDYIRGRQHT
jgi:hypothetical protein